MSVRFSGTQRLSRTANVPDDAAWTAAMWCRIVTDTNSNVALANLEDSGLTTLLAIGMAADGTTLTVYHNDGNSSFSVAALTAGTDYFVAITSSGTGAGATSGYTRAFGVNTLTSASIAGTRTAFAPARITAGSLSDGTFPFNGRLWNLKVWDRALTAAELLVESYYAQCMFPASRNFHWPLKNVNDTRDISGNGRTPTVTGTLTTEGETSLFVPRRRIFIPAAAAGATIYTRKPFDSPIFQSRVIQ